MKHLVTVLSVVVLASCAAHLPSTLDVGSREAMRLRSGYSTWLAERPRKMEWMSVPADSLSKEARAAGFVGGTVDPEVVMLSTAEGQGFLFGHPSASEIQAMKRHGSHIGADLAQRCFRFSDTLKMKPNQITAHNAGWRFQFRFAVSAFWSGVCEFWR